MNILDKLMFLLKIPEQSNHFFLTWASLYLPAGEKSLPKPGVSRFFSVKGQMVNILGFVGQTVCVTAPHFCCRSVKVVIDNT